MKRHALFVGVDDYSDPTIQNLTFPTKDANDLAGAFEWSLKFDRVEKLLGPEHADDILDAVDDMKRGLNPGDLFFFFFAGHGFRVKDNHVLVCARDSWGDLEDEDAGLRVGRLKKKMRGPWNRMIVLDACQNDIRATRGADCGVTARDLSLIHGGDAAAQAGEGVQILVTSCSEGQKALEVADLRHGLFTSAFLETVKTFSEKRRFLDPVILRDDLSSRMQNLAVRYRLVGSQEPMFTIPGNTRIVLLDGVSAPPLSPHGAPVVPSLVVCPLCGKKNEPKDTFKCRKCGRDNLCLRHQDEETFLCKECAATVRVAEAQRKATDEAMAIEEARIAQENAQHQNAEQTAHTRQPIIPKPNGQYRETVNGLTWNFEVKAGKATIGSSQHEDDTVVPHAALADEPTGDVVVPQFLGGCPVTGIGDSAFAFCKKITSVTMPHGIVGIGNYAFDDCCCLKSIKIPTSVKYIGTSAFECCFSLASIVVPDSVEIIGSWAFTNCRVLASVTISKSVSCIEDSMFACCSELASVVIPVGVTRIEDRAFQDCESLEDVEIPEGLVSIGECAFEGCENLKDVSIPASVAYIGVDAFPEDVAVRGRDGTNVRGETNFLIWKGDNAYYGRNGVVKNFAEAMKWYRQGAEQGCARAQRMLGFMYMRGECAPLDYEEAAKWFGKAAEQGEAVAQGLLGIMYFEGQGVKKDCGKTYDLFSKAAEQGNAVGQFGLALLLESIGKTDEAIEWYRKAAEQGNESAQKALRKLEAKVDDSVDN